MNTEQSPPESQEVLVSEQPGILVITLNRPAAKNAVNKAVADGVAAALDTLDARDDLSIAVITGAGGSFCSGMDLKAFLRGERPVVEGRGLAGITQRPPRKPVIAAVEGYALAGGCEIVLACDLVVASRSARFGLPEVKRGLIAAAGGLMRLPDRIPRNIAMELALTGDMVDAQRFHEWGLVNVLTDDGQALEEALTLAGRIARNGPLAVAASKQVMTEYRGWPVEDPWPQQQAITEAINASQDAAEGARAFAEKRDPVWQGR